eukprot:COSAG02_NODE_63459_length_263_cov_0.628049_1_plen_42_part_01
MQYLRSRHQDACSTLGLCTMGAAGQPASVSAVETKSHPHRSS